MQSKNVKIIFIQPGFAHYRAQLFYLLDAKFKIKYIYERSFNVYPGEIKTSNLDCIFLPSGKVKKWFELIRIFKTDKPDIIITSISSSFRTFLSYIFCKISNKKIILWIEEWKKPRYKVSNAAYIAGNIRNILSKKIILNSDALIVSGKASYDYAISLGRNADGIFYSLQCSNDVSKGKLVSESFNSNNKNRFIYLYLSRIVIWKGLDILLRAFARLEKENADVALIVGGDGDFKQYCIELSYRLGIKNVEFRGAINPDKVANIFNEADAFILPSYFYGNSYEAWGLVINEAMSMGLPIITTTAVGAAFDLVEDGVNGHVINQNNTDELYHAMDRMINEDVVKMGQASRNIFEEKNNYYNMASAFSDAIYYVMKP